MADSGGASRTPNPGGSPDSGPPKKTLDQGVQLLPLLINFFKTVAFLFGVWGVGYFRFSFSWVMIGFYSYMLSEEYRKIRDSKKKFAQDAVKNEKETILARCDDLPSWVFFPDVERAEWLNKILRQMWPYIGTYTKNLLQTSVTASIQAKLPSSLKPFKFEHVDLGDVPPRIGGVKVYVDNVKRDEILLDMEIIFASDTEIKMTVTHIDAGIKDLQIHGTVRVVMKPLVPVVPFIGGISVFFLNQPTVNFDLTGIADILDKSPLSNFLNSIISDQIGNLMVLPNRLTIPLVKNIDLQALKYPLPSGVLRLHVVQAKELILSDFGKGKSDPYVKINVGTKAFETKVVKDNINPVWNQSYEVVMDYKEDQDADFHVLDVDPVGKDDTLGMCSLDIQSVASKGHSDTWLPLENVKTGKLHLRAVWMHLSKNPDDLDRQAKRDTESEELLSSALLIVTLDSAKDLPRGKKSLSEPQAYAKLTIGNETQQSLPSATRTVNPTWESNFQYLISDPQNQDLTVQVLNSLNTDFPLGNITFPIKTLLTAKDMTSEQVLPLNDSGDTSELRLRLCLRVLTSVQPADWATDTVHTEHAAPSTPAEGTSVDPTTPEPSSPPSSPPQVAPATFLSTIHADKPVKPHSQAASADAPARPPAPAAPAQPDSSLGGGGGGGGGVARPAEEVLLKDTPVKTPTGISEAGMRHRMGTVSSTTSSEGSLGRIQVTIRYSQDKTKLVVVVHKCVNLVGHDDDNLSDPYVCLVLLPSKDKEETKVIKNDLNPIFDETFKWSVTMQEAQTSTLELTIKNKNKFFKADSHMGIVTIDLSTMDLAQAHTEWFNLEEPEETD